MLSKKARRQIRVRILGYNFISVVLIGIGMLGLVLIAGLLFIEMGPRERYYFPVVLSGLVIASAISKTLAIKITKARKVSDLVLLSRYNEVGQNTKILGLIPMVGVLRPTLYQAKMDCPNAFACGLNLFWLARLPILGSAIVISDELIELIRDKQQMQAILAHELGHIASLDIATASALALLNSILGLYLRLGIGWRILLGIEFLLVFPIWLVWKLLNSTLSQVRELVADLKSVLALGNATHLANALSQIAEFNEFPNAKSAFADLFLSHPRVQKRVQRLREIEGLK